MTGRYLVSFRKKLFYVSAHTCPFRQLRWHLSQGKAFHTLLQRRSAPRKAVRLLPVIRGRLFYVRHFLIFGFTHTKIWILFSLMSASPELGGKCRACEAIGASWRTPVRIFKSCTLCLDSSLFPVLFHNDIPDRFFRPFENDRQVFNIVL